MNTMSALDASFLHIEDAVSHMHIGSVAIFEGPAPAQADVLAMVAGKLALVPRYRQRVRFVPLALGRPVWVDDPHFNLDYHVRRTALPAPGGDRSCATSSAASCRSSSTARSRCGRCGSSRALGEGRWALISKVHH